MADVFVAKTDPYGKTETIVQKPDGTLTGLIAEANGALRTTEGKRLKETINITLAIPRDKQLFEKSFSNISIMFFQSGNLKLYPDSNGDNKAMTINQSMSIEMFADRFYISNTPQAGVNIEIWLFE